MSEVGGLLWFKVWPPRFNLSCKQQTLAPPTDKSRSLPPTLIFQVDSKRPGHDTGVKIQNI